MSHYLTRCACSNKDWHLLVLQNRCSELYLKRFTLHFCLFEYSNYVCARFILLVFSIISPQCFKNNFYISGFSIKFLSSMFLIMFSVISVLLCVLWHLVFISEMVLSFFSFLLFPFWSWVLPISVHFYFLAIFPWAVVIVGGTFCCHLPAGLSFPILSIVPWKC